MPDTPESIQPDPLTPQGPADNPHEGVRKLAAVMFTDIKDFSKKMQKDEQATMRMLTVHNTMMRQTVHKYSGIVVKTVGDAFLVMFNSVVSATQCAIEVQQKFYEYNLQFRADEDRILVRIGIHLGDIIETDKDIFGDGVNIASRVQSTAEVGGLNISESVYQQVRSKLNIRVIDLGVPQLK
ncbi:MAG TPA: adenylate/guanylate cyclase domain-containing protein, partial [Bacteroidota bacterium]|nr:adenylate/guanylate cyclase domain-containing protein [Bacteroidota bacterium]